MPKEITKEINSDIFSVSDYLDQLNFKLKSDKAKILGEVCDLKLYDGRSYLYFSVKDKKDQSILKCFMWKRDFVISGVNLADGMEVIISAYPNIYKPNGGMTMQVESIELVGEGALKLAYEELKKKLEIEGLFSIERKREIPLYPKRIGVITSKSGAVISDFLSNIGKFGYEILFVDSKVEGVEAIKDLLSAIETLKNREIDVLVMMRGGGSLESFLAFNNETLIRAIADFPVPVITGIGHDKDVPLVSLVSDSNVSTPTAVANLLNSSWSLALSDIKIFEEKIFNRFALFLGVFQQAEQTLLQGLARIESEIKNTHQILVQKEKEIFVSFNFLINSANEFLKNSFKAIEFGDPKRQLAKGFSIVRSGNKILRKVSDVKKGNTLDILVSDGSIQSKVI